MYLDLEHIISQCILHVELLQTEAQSALHMWERWSTLYFDTLLVDMVRFTDMLVCKARIFLITAPVHLEAVDLTPALTESMVNLNHFSTWTQEFHFTKFSVPLVYSHFNCNRTIPQLENFLHRSFYLVKHLPDIQLGQVLPNLFHDCALYYCTSKHRIQHGTCYKISYLSAHSHSYKAAIKFTISLGL